MKQYCNACGESWDDYYETHSQAKCNANRVKSGCYYCGETRWHKDSCPKVQNSRKQETPQYLGT